MIPAHLVPTFSPVANPTAVVTAPNLRGLVLRVRRNALGKHSLLKVRCTLPLLICNSPPPFP